MVFKDIWSTDTTMQHKVGLGQRRNMGDTNQQNLEFNLALCLWSFQMQDKLVN
jgi:hypothetical protein